MLKKEPQGADSRKMSPSLSNIVKNDKLKWIFVGGKGGVGKTTCSCSLALKLSEVRRNVLLVATDPSYNVSHALGQKFGRLPTKLNGFPNVDVIEMVAKDADVAAREVADTTDLRKNILDFLDSVPGVEELMAYAELIKLADRGEYDVVIFDTAPTGHTSMSLLSLPATLEELLVKAVAMSNQFTPLLNIFQGFQGLDAGCMSDIFHQLGDLLASVRKVNAQLSDPASTTFICVCTPDFLSVYETEQLIQQLSRKRIDCRNIVVNQLTSTEPSDACKFCYPRFDAQKKYLRQIHDLYEDYHVTEVPLVAQEIRGIAELKDFSAFLVI